MTRLGMSLAILIASMVLGTDARSQEWPQKPVKLVVGTAPGGLVDIMGRLIAKYLADEIGQPTVVENKPGAGGNIAAKIVASAPPDGHTLLLTGNNHAVNPTLLPNPGFNYETDFAPVAMIAQSNMILTASPSLPARDVAGVIGLARKSPDMVSMAISPIGTPNHLGAELLMQMANIKLTIIPYSGVSAAIPDLMSNRIQLALGAVPSVLPYVQDGRLKALAVTRLSRTPFAPQIPTADESGLKGYDVNAWTCMMAPAGTPAAALKQINAAMAKVLSNSELREVLGKQGAELSAMSPEELGSFISREATKWATVLKNAHVRQ